MIIVFIITIAPILVAICGDKLLEKTRTLPLRAIIDSFTHGIIGCLSWLVILVTVHSSRNYVVNRSIELLLSGFLASMIDIDHFIAARSLNLSDAMSLGVRRPPLHATTILLLVVIPSLVVAKMLRKNVLSRLSMLILVAIGSHHIRDAVRRGLWFPPLGSTPPLPQAIYLVSIGLFPHLIAQLIPSSKYTNIPAYTIV